MTTKINGTGCHAAQFAALDEEAQIAVTMHQNSQKDRAEGRKDRQAARKDEIRQMRAKADELRKAATRNRIMGIASFAAGAATAVAGATTGLQGVGVVAKSAGAAIVGTTEVIEGIAKSGMGALQYAYNDADTQATLANIGVGEKLANNRAQNASEDIQDAKKGTDTAKDLMQKLADARFRAMQTASR